MRQRLPLVTGAVVAAAIVAWAVPALGELLILDRAHVLGGEWWRVVTGSLVHYSASHLASDVLAFGVAGALLERRSRAAMAALTVASPLSVGAAVLLFQPQLDRYAGLSGMAYAAIVALALAGLREVGTMRMLSGAALVGCVAKLAWEMSSHRMLLVDAPAGVVTVPVAHVAGALAALVVAWSRRRVDVAVRAEPPRAGGAEERFS